MDRNIRAREKDDLGREIVVVQVHHSSREKKYENEKSRELQVKFSSPLASCKLGTWIMKNRAKYFLTLITRSEEQGGVKKYLVFSVRFTVNFSLFLDKRTILRHESGRKSTKCCKF